MRQLRLRSGTDADAPPPPFEVRKTFWGYVIRGTDGPPLLLQVAQGTVLALGAACTAGALILVSGLDGGEGGTQGIRVTLTIVLCVLALMLVWFATRGGVVELQFDFARGELRELVRHRMGRATVLGRHGLDPEAKLWVTRDGGGRVPCSLLLLLKGESEAICIAQGHEPALQELRRRLDQELRGQQAGAARDSLTA